MTDVSVEDARAIIKGAAAAKKAKVALGKEFRDCRRGFHALDRLMSATMRSGVDLDSDQATAWKESVQAYVSVVDQLQGSPEPAQAPEPTPAEKAANAKAEAKAEAKAKAKAKAKSAPAKKKAGKKKASKKKDK